MRRLLPAPAVLVTELVAGLVVALALIPEAISFSLIAGVDPRVGLYASFTMAVTIAFAGGRPAMVSAATGAMALVVVSLVRDHGAEFLLAATLLAGLLQVLFGMLGIARLMRFVPRSVMTGFVNALAILVFMAQLPYLDDAPMQMYVLVVVGLLLLWLLPKLTRVVPAALLTIIALTTAAVVLNLDVPTVGDQGELPDALPVLGIPSVPFTLETFRIILPYAITLSIVGLLESLLTAQLVDEITDTESDKNREARGQGIANLVTGAFGGMAGCAVVGQTLMNVKSSGARTRLSTGAAGVLLMVLVVALGSVVAVIPMGALVAVMFVVAATAFDWHSIQPATLRRMPKGETGIMLATVATTVWTHNLALGVGVGVLTATLVFARRVSRVVRVTSELSADGQTRTYTVMGELFFASDHELTSAFDFAGDPPHVRIDMSGAHIWDTSAIAALDSIETRYARHGVQLEVIGMNELSSELHERHTGRLANT